jgi:hypothetical protein
VNKEEEANIMEMAYETWKEGIVFEGNHRGYDIVIRSLGDGYFKHYCGYIKIPQNHKYNGFQYEDIDIKAPGGLIISVKIENDWWIGWAYEYYPYNYREHGLVDIFMDCCDVIMQLIEEEGENDNTNNNRSTLSKQLSEHIANINAKRSDMGMEIDIINKCIICGKPTFSEVKSEQITNINRKKTNIDKEIEHTFASDPKKAMKLINKVNRYEREIKKIENPEVRKLICDNCDRELSKKDIIELLNLYKEHHLMASVIKDKLHFDFSKYRNAKSDRDESDFKDEDEDYSIYNETVNSLSDNICDKKLYEYYKARLLFMLKYYDKALISFQNLLDNHEQIKEFDIREYYYKDELTGEDLNYYDEREKFKKETIDSIPEEINKIKEILGIV